MVAPFNCEVDAHEAETVQELLETLAVDQFELRKADAQNLTMEFGAAVMHPQRTLAEIGMCDQAAFSVLGSARQQKARQHADKVNKVDLVGAASKGRLEQVLCVSEVSPERVNERRPPYRQYTPLHKAVMGGHLPVARALLEANADVDARDEWAQQS
eukprot:TRINITY_DN7061_c0_g1_i1.p2 TRINITY_DN7061_c0_g1~~TRINITY_DN7061_c0_g1_i1.p2  ORF type:complete len:157 (+),score=44.83 TRINITY_DN7061_c0_g1_i1:193-663(+)